MTFASLCCCSWFSHLFTWFVVRHASIHIVAHRFVWFVVIFASVVYLLICSRWLPGDSLVCYGGGLVLSRGCCLCHGLVASVHTSCVGFAFARFVGCCDHKWGRVLLSHRDVHFVVSRRESHSFVSVRAQWCASRRESRE